MTTNKTNKTNKTNTIGLLCAATGLSTRDLVAWYPAAQARYLESLGVAMVQW